jgi:hypothetical protein
LAEAEILPTYLPTYLQAAQVAAGAEILPMYQEARVGAQQAYRKPLWEPQMPLAAAYRHSPLPLRAVQLPGRVAGYW